MFFPTFLLAAAATLALPALATPLSPSEITTHPTLLSERAPEGCTAKNASANPDISIYRFTIDANIRERAAAANLTRIGVEQWCDYESPVFYHGTINWAYADLDKFGPDEMYNIEVKRCKKDFTRHVGTYTVFLCNKYDWCDAQECGESRRVCNDEKWKAVDVLDPVSWQCGV